MNTRMVNNVTEIGPECRASMQGPVRGYVSTRPSFAAQVTTILAIFQNRSSNPSACWEWPGPRDTDGYGRVLKGKYYRRAHRVSYELANGPIPHSLCVLHRCDNRACIRPSHLFLGTRRDNALDKTLKRRVRRSRLGLPFGVARQPKNTLKPYAAQIRENGKIKRLGYFATIAEAAAAAASAREDRATRLRVELARDPTDGRRAL